MAHGGDEDDIRVVRIHSDARDVARVFKMDVRPGFTGVHGLPHSIAIGDIAADAGFAGADINHVGIVGRDGDCADGADVSGVRQWRPVLAGVRCLPNAAGHRTEIINVGIARHTGDGEHASAALRANQSPPQWAPHVRLKRLGQRNNCSQQ